MKIYNLPKMVLKAAIKTYMYLVSPWLGVNKCRFFPSCSHYAIDAIDAHGAAKGGLLSIKRILRCHPWHRGEMMDPVPSSIDWKDIMGYNSACHKCRKDLPKQ